MVTPTIEPVKRRDYDVKHQISHCRSPFFSNVKKSFEVQHEFVDCIFAENNRNNIQLINVFTTTCS
jgi:hypothetical protein